MAESEASIFRAIRESRDAVRRNEKRLLLQLARQWLPVRRYLKDQVNALTAIIRNRQDEGKPVEIEYLYSLDRYRRMMEETDRAIRKYNKAAQGLIEGAETEMTELGIRSGRNLVHIAEPDDPLWTRVNLREMRIMTGMLSEKSPLTALLEKSWGAAKKAIEDVLLLGLSSGQGSKWIADRLMEAVDIPYKRAQTIARTEANRAYRQANLETMRESRAVIGYRRMCYPPTACFACLMMDGEFYDKEESFSDHPNGKCSAVPVTRHFDPINDKSWERGQDWFARQDPETQRKLMGPGRFDLWQSGQVDLRDMVYIKENPLWGGSPTMRTLEDLKSGITTGVDASEIVNKKLFDTKITDAGEVVNPMDRDEYERIKNGLEKQGVEVFAATEGDDLRYMLILGAEGTYSDGRITHIGEIPSRSTFFEEIIHMKQARDYGELDSTDYTELYAREIEANRKLLKYNKAYRFDDLDVSDIERNLKAWESKFLQATGIDFDESNYRKNY